MRKIWSSGLVWGHPGRGAGQLREKSTMELYFSDVKAFPWRLLSVPWTARRSNQSILKEISPAYSLEELMLKLKLQSFGHLMQRTDSFKKTLMTWEKLKAGKGDDKGWDSWMPSPTRWTWVWASSGNWWWTEKPAVLQSMRSQRIRYDWVIELNWKFSLL